MSSTRGGDVIDLCDSSFGAEEHSFTINSPTKTASSNTTAAAITKVKSHETFWDSSSSEGEQDKSSSRKHENRDRRNSKLVSPEETQRKEGIDTSFNCGYSSDELVKDDHLNRKYGAKRKQPRVLFSNHHAKGVKIASTPKIEAFFPKKDEAYNQNAEQKALAFDTSSSSDDDSVNFITSGLTRKKTLRKSATREPARMPQDTIVVLTSSDDEVELDKKPKAETNTSSRPFAAVVNPYIGEGRKNEAVNLPNAASSPVLFPQFLQYPIVGPRSYQQHEDHRAKYILALWKYTRTLASASYNLTKLDAYCRRIRDLALLQEFPIRSLGEYLGERHGLENSSSLQEALKIGGVDQIKIPVRRDKAVDGYFSIAEAALVGMLEHLENKSASSGIDFADETKAVQFCQDKEQWVFLKDLIPLIDQRLDNSLAPAKLERSGDDDRGEMFYSNPSTKSAEFKQLEQLTKEEAGSNMPLLKSHRRNKRPCFALTLRGLQKAKSLRRRQFPAPPGYLRTSKLYEDGLDTSFQGICLVVDHREGGGASKKLHALCQGLDMRKVPYIVTKLDIGDYAFVSMDTQKLMPIIIERKSIQDVAQSIWDGRWTSQKRRMYQGQYVFGFETCRLAYLIEGRADTQELTGGAMGQAHFNVTRQKLDLELESLCLEGFEVITTNNINGSLAKLVELCQDVSRDYRNGKLTAEFTYEEFMQRVRSIPVGTDFSRIAKDRYSAKTLQSVSPAGTECRPTSDGLSTQKSLATIKTDNELAARYNSWKLPQLKDECDKYGLPKTGNKASLIQRLLGPRPPEAWLRRKTADLYVPSRYDTCTSAILVAIWLHQRQNEDSWKGLDKGDIISFAESLKISKDPFSGTGKGLFNYDGWSCIGQLREGQSPLVFREKGGFFKLTTVGGDISGFQIAAAMHEWCHVHNKCRCHDIGFD